MENINMKNAFNESLAEAYNDDDDIDLRPKDIQVRAKNDLDEPDYDERSPQERIKSFMDPNFDTSKTDYTEILKMLVQRGKTEKEIMDFAHRDLANEKSNNEIHAMVTKFFQSQQNERLEIPDFLKRDVKEGELDNLMGDNNDDDDDDYQNTEEDLVRYAAKNLGIQQPKTTQIFNGRSWVVVEESSQKAYVVDLNASPPTSEDVDFKDAMSHFTNDVTEMASGGATGAGAVASVAMPLGGMKRRNKKRKK